MDENRIEIDTEASLTETRSVSTANVNTPSPKPELPGPDSTPAFETNLHENDNVPKNYTHSSASSRCYSEVEGSVHGIVDEGSQTGAKSASSRSSLSSIPDSVLIHPKDPSVHGRYGTDDIYEEEDGQISYDNPVYQKIRDRNSPFRHPSSVRAIQMQTEDEDDDDVLSPSRRKAIYRGSPASVRSLGSPLLRRHGYHSAGGTPRKSPVKRENPLVLLHCTILKPSLALGPAIAPPDRQMLEKVLPPDYWRRWKLLEESTIASGLLRDRGLLIQHPQEDYGLLEERLLESLELQKPRLENGHWNGDETSDSESEGSIRLRESHDEVSQDKCADCGCRNRRAQDRKKWDIKIYAANGLLKEGAWTAVWKEIERVDVQINLLLPYEIKCEVEKRISEETALIQEQKNQHAVINASERHRSPVNDISQDEIDGLIDEPDRRPAKFLKKEDAVPRSTTPQVERARKKKLDENTDLHTLIINSIRVLARDRRNIITAISMLVAVMAVLFGGRNNKNSHQGSEVFRFHDFPAVSTQVYYTTSTSYLTHRSTEVPTFQSQKCMERSGEIQRVVEGLAKSVEVIAAPTQVESLADAQATSGSEFELNEQQKIYVSTENAHTKSSVYTSPEPAAKSTLPIESDITSEDVDSIDLSGVEQKQEYNAASMLEEIVVNEDGKPAISRSISDAHAAIAKEHDDSEIAQTQRSVDRQDHFEDSDLLFELSPGTTGE